jgi:lipopolysaccharide export system protein LptC
MKKTRIAAAVLAVVAVAAGGWFAWQKLAPRVTPSSQPALVALDSTNLATLKQSFNDAKGKTRIVALLSPT